MLEELLHRALGITVDLSGAAPLALLLRVPSWLGNDLRHPENCEAPLDLGYAAALARRQGYRAAILDLETGAFTLDAVAEALRSARPEVVVLSGITPAADHLLWLARAAKEARPQTLTVACGQHVDAVPESLLFPGSPVDVGVAGEFEETVAEVLGAARSGGDLRVRGTITLQDGKPVSHGERPLITDLDALPYPSHDFFRSRLYRHLHPMRHVGRYRWGFIQSSRGCPFPCIYCSKTLRTSFGTPLRARAAANVVEEMRYLERRGVNVLVFTDDVFNLRRDRVMELCEAIRSSGVRLSWKAQGRATPGDLEMFRAMRAAGCSTISFGVESGSPPILETLEKRMTVPEIEAAFRLAREAGLLRVAFFLVGSPSETIVDFERTVALMHRLVPDIVQVANFTCYPGSTAYEHYFADREARWDEFQHYEKSSNLSAESDAEMATWQRRLYRAFVLRPGYLLRYARLKHVNLLFNFETERYLVAQALKTLFVRR
ncbi:MAG: radical SAM protein [Deltaproteobacteria bacterium]|nr:radical SAM protein [Deltaproteobacteria bacterium]